MTFPTDKFESIGFPELMVDTRSPEARYFRHKTVGSKAPFYMIPMTTVLLEYGEGRRVGAVLNSYQARKHFDLPNPIPAVKQLSGLTIAENLVKGSSELKVRGLPPNQIGAVCAGDFFQPAGHTKVYEACGDANSDSQGRAIIPLSQDLLYDYPVNAVVKQGEDVVWRGCIDRNGISGGEIESKQGKHMVYDVEFLEQAD